GERPTRAAHRARSADPHFTELMNHRPRGGELAAQSAFEAERDFRVHLRTRAAMPRERRQNALDTAEEIATVNVENVHVRTATADSYTVSNSRARRPRSNARIAVCRAARPSAARFAG